MPLPASRFTTGTDMALAPLIARSGGGGTAPKYLDGRTADGSVGTATNTWDPFTGTHWTAREVSPGIVTLKMSLFPSDRLLDGRTANGSVGLAEAADNAHSGVFWEPIITDHVKPRRGEFGDDFDVWILRCLGVINGNRFLDFRSQDGSVGLAPFIDGPFTGTRWTLILNPERHPPNPR